MKGLIWILRGLLGLVLLGLIALSGALLYSHTVQGEEPPRLFGYGPYHVENGEMAPALYAGDLAILSFDEDSQPGDIVAFYKEGQLVLRRVVGTSEGFYITQQEAFGQPDAQLLDPAQVVAVSVTYLPGCGALGTFFYSPIGLGVLVLAAFLLLVLPALLSLGGRAPEEGPTVDYGAAEAIEPRRARRAAGPGPDGLAGAAPEGHFEKMPPARTEPARARAAGAGGRGGPRPDGEPPAPTHPTLPDEGVPRRTRSGGGPLEEERPRRSGGSHYKPRH